MGDGSKVVESKAVCCEVIGGLGNQLFIIAATLDYALKSGRRCAFRRTWPLSQPGAQATYWHTLFHALPHVSDSDWQQISKAAFVYSDYKPGHRPLPYLQDKSIVQLCGYFQSAKYFDLNRIKDWLFPTHLFDFSRKLLKELPGNESFAFMHFRRGNYKGLQNVHNLLPINYYEKASGQFGQHVQFLIFCESEDMNDIKNDIQKSKVLSKRIHHFADNRIPDYLQLMMMAQCPEGGIVANSSFSVWAAYLQPKSNTIVSPKRWFAIPQEALLADLSLTHWIKLDN